MRNKKYLLLGLGIGNNAIKEYFDKEQIKYIIYDDYIGNYLNNIDFNNFDVLIKSSGISNDHFIIKYCIILKKQIITDLEAFYLFSNNKKIICITGTNGKTTTSYLIHHLLDELDLAGNIGIPLMNLVESKNDIIIESSSFMLEYVDRFHPNIVLITNFYPNHLDHHKTYKNYLKSKLRILKNIKPNDYLIYNYDNLFMKRLFENLDVNKIPISIKENCDGIYLCENFIYNKNEFLYDINNFKILGEHNIYNYLFAIGALIAYESRAIWRIPRLELFAGVEHRIEYIGNIGSKSVYNDSKSTNTRSLLTAINSFIDKNVLLICGGLKRIDDLNILNNSLKGIKVVMVNGDNKEELFNYFNSKNIKVIKYETLNECLQNITNHLESVDTILFSPGAQSYDQFKSFEERGLYFKKTISKYFKENEYENF